MSFNCRILQAVTPNLKGCIAVEGAVLNANEAGPQTGKAGVRLETFGCASCCLAALRPCLVRG